MTVFPWRAAPAAPVSFGVCGVASLLTAACIGGAPLRSTPADGALSCRQTVSASVGAPAPLVRWIATREEDRLALDAWCRGVGPVVYEQPPQAPSPSPQAPIAVVSWNVNVGAGDLGALVADLRAGRFSHGRPVERFVLLVQEALRAGSTVPLLAPGQAGARRLVRSAHPIDVVTFAREEGLSLFYVPSMRNGLGEDRPGEDRGNAILSTLPLRDARALELPFERQRRVAAVATLDTIGAASPVTVASVHLDAFVSRRRLWLFGAAGARGRQARALVDALPSSGPLVVGGDFNTWLGTGEPAVVEMRRITDRAPLPHEDTFSGGRVLDYLFFRASPSWTAEYRRADRPYGSDHYPLVGWLRGL